MLKGRSGLKAKGPVGMRSATAHLGLVFVELRLWGSLSCSSSPETESFSAIQSVPEEAPPSADSLSWGFSQGLRKGFYEASLKLTSPSSVHKRGFNSPSKIYEFHRNGYKCLLRDHQHVALHKNEKVIAGRGHGLPRAASTMNSPCYVRGQWLL